MSEWHRGRSWGGTVIEDTCPCPKEPCGLVSQPVAECKEHWWERAKTIRQAHAPEDCPAALVVRRRCGVSGADTARLRELLALIKGPGARHKELNEVMNTLPGLLDLIDDVQADHAETAALHAAELAGLRARVIEECAQAVEAAGGFLGGHSWQYVCAAAVRALAGEPGP